MSLLAPLWLGLLVAAAVPVLLHLLRRRSGLRVDFPAVRFLVQAQLEHQRELRIRNLLLMALRVLAVVALAIAAARPVGSVGGPGHAPTAVALVLDNSLSTGAVRNGASIVAELSVALGAVLEGMTAADRAWLLTPDGAVITGVEAVRSALRSVTPLAGAGDLPGTIARAATFAAGSGLPSAHVVVATDGQRSSLGDGAIDAAAPVTFLTPATPALPNHAVIDARPEPSRWSPRGTLTVGVRSPDSTEIRVALADRTIARTRLGPDGTATLAVQAWTDGWAAGRVETTADELRGDDVRHFAVQAGPPPAMVISADAGPFLAGAIAALIEGGRARSGGAIAITVAEAIGQRPVLAVAPRDPVRIGAANRALAGARIPWQLGERRADTARVRGGVLDGVRVLDRYALTSSGPDSGTVLASVAGEPWIVAGTGYVLVASPVDPAATSLPLDARFVPWLEQALLQHLLVDGGRVYAVAPGASVSLVESADELVLTDSSVRPLADRQLSAPHLAGVHWLRRNGRIVGAIVVNAEASESDPTILASDALVDRIAAGRASATADAAAARARVFDTAARRSLRTVVLLLLLGLLLAEAWIAREPRRVHS